jgi:hypothetical protein
MESQKRKKDRWDKADIVLRATIGVLTPLVIALIGYMLNSSLRRAEAEAANLRLYSQLMSSREQADSGLRKDVLMSTMASFLAAEDTDIESKLLRLELLATNFHDSLNLKPLFLHLDRLLVASSKGEVAWEEEAAERVRSGKAQEEREQQHAAAWGVAGLTVAPTKGGGKWRGWEPQRMPPEEVEKKRDRLEKMAREVARKQMVVLEAVGKTAELLLSPKLEEEGKQEKEKSDEPRTEVVPMALDGVGREFRIQLIGADEDRRDVEIRVSIFTRGESEAAGETDVVFSVGFYDFPMIDNLRLSRDQRLAVVLMAFAGNGEDSVAKLRLLYFPGRYACLREKPYFQDVIENLRRLQ